MMCCNNIRPMSCYEEREKITIEDKDIKVNFKYELKNIFTLLSHSEKKNRLLGIELAKGVFKMDCHDLCHIYKKELIFKGKQHYHGLVLSLEVAEFLLNGWQVHQLIVPSAIGRRFESTPPVIELQLTKSFTEINMRLPEKMRTFVTDLMNKNYKLKNYAYRYILLNWDK